MMSVRHLRYVLGIFLLVSGVLSTPVRADGMVIRSHEDRWLPYKERSQDALILHRNGVQRMLLAIEVENPDAGNMVWILPVPASPAQVVLDVLSGFPRVHGTEVFGGAKDHLQTMGYVAIGMQIWPVVGGFLFYAIDSLFAPEYGPRGKAPPPAAKAEAAKGAPPLTVHQHVEKAGMVSEVITAREGGALYQYLGQKGLNIKPGALPVLDYYVGKDYTFIASWLGGAQTGSPSEREREQGFTRGIEVRFPSREIFFPLRPTSVYGEAVVPATIRVAGYVTPKPFADIAPHVKTGYHVSDPLPPEPPAFWGAFDEVGDGRYTKIDINAPSTRFTDDLWIAPTSPAGGGLLLASFVVRHPVVTFIVLVAAVSALLSVLVGWLLYKELRTRRGAIRLATIGMANCLTFLGIVVAAIRALPGGRKRIAGFLACFSVAFIAAAFFVTFGAAALLDALRP